MIVDVSVNSLLLLTGSWFHQVQVHSDCFAGDLTIETTPLFLAFQPNLPTKPSEGNHGLFQQKPEHSLGPASLGVTETTYIQSTNG